MDLFTLSSNFLAKDVVDQFVSAIWTDRYGAAGDFQIVVPVTPENLDLLAEGTYLGLRGSKEVMQVESQSLKNGLLTVVGGSLIKEVLSLRYLWAYNPENSTDQRIVNYVDDTRKPGDFISSLVTKWAISPGSFPAAWVDANLDWVNESIPFLTLGDVDASGTVQRIEAPVGPLYDAVTSVAAQYSVGISLYLDSADPITGYSLKFKTYQGKDLTSAQEVNPLVRLALETEGLSEAQELRSMAMYKNVVYVYYEGKITKHLADPGATEPMGMDRRVLVVDNFGTQQPTATGTKIDWSGGVGGGSGGMIWFPGLYGPDYTVKYVTEEDKTAFRNQIAKDALANHNYIRAIDGQASPFSDYKYGTDYDLGDIIELEGMGGTVSNARVTEYIRSQDQSGDRAYPTISVVS